MIAVADASPLIGLSKAARLRLLQVLYEEVLLPPQVYKDVVVQGWGRAGSRAVRNAVAAGWMRIVPVSNPALIPPRFAGTGEGEAIALAQERHADVILIDDRAARNECHRLGLRWVSTAGVLRDAKRMKAVRQIKPILDRLQAKGFGLFDYEEILKSVGEWP